MSKIDELIEELCPEGVPWQPLLEVCQEILVPMRDRPKDLSGDIPWCRIEDIDRRRLAGSKMGLGVSLKVVKEMNLKVFPAGTVVASCSASLGTYAIAEQPVITNQTFIGLVCGSKIENKYLLYLLTTMTGAIKKLASTGTIPYVSREKFERLLVPVPPLEVQREIVSILDKFTQLEAELEAELEARRIQYEVTGDRLLDFSDTLQSHPVGEMIRELCPEGVSFAQLRTVASIGTGSSDKKDSDTDGPYPFFVRSKQVYRSQTFEFEETAILIPGEGGIGEIFHFHQGPYALHQRAYRVAPNAEQLEPKFLFYFMIANFKQHILARAVSATVTSIRKPMIESFPVALPPLEIQREIVSILDKLDILVNDISIGLPAEIAARRKQYEYYRNKLLTFKELEAA